MKTPCPQCHGLGRFDCCAGTGMVDVPDEEPIVGVKTGKASLCEADWVLPGPMKMEAVTVNENGNIVPATHGESPLAPAIREFQKIDSITVAAEAAAEVTKALEDRPSGFLGYATEDSKPNQDFTHTVWTNCKFTGTVDLMHPDVFDELCGDQQIAIPIGHHGDAHVRISKLRQLQQTVRHIGLIDEDLSILDACISFTCQNAERTTQPPCQPENTTHTDTTEPEST